MSRRTQFEFAFLLLAAAAALALRTFAVAVYAIPSGSMQPTLLPGDYVLAWKWPFAGSRPALPARGDIIVFHAPPDGRAYIKRVIGGPGETVALRDGTILLGGHAVPRWRIADFVTSVTPRDPCRPSFGAALRIEPAAGGGSACRSPRWREALPGGALVDTLDLGPSDGDAFGPLTIPAGRLFVLGDDRDRSADSRWPAGQHGAVGLVPARAVIGRAVAILFSVDGSARWNAPASWAAAVRWDRIGTALSLDRAAG